MSLNLDKIEKQNIATFLSSLFLTQLFNTQTNNSFKIHAQVIK